MADEAVPGVPVAEAEWMKSPTVSELLLPPFICLACLSGGLILWTMVHRYMTRKSTSQMRQHRVDVNSPRHRRPPPCLWVNHLYQHSNKVRPTAEQKQQHSAGPTSAAERGDNDTLLFTMRPPQKPQLSEPKSLTVVGRGGDAGKEPLSIAPLFSQASDLLLVDQLRGRGPTNARELLYILLPVIFTLGFCPVTLHLHKPVVTYLWPPELYPSAPNINDAIACFLVPAGMVYAISFGFAFQQVATGFRETELGVYQQVAQLTKLLVLVKELTVTLPTTRLEMVRVIKDMTLTSFSRLLGQEDPSRDEFSQGDEDLLRLLYTSQLRSSVNVKDCDPWQRSVYQRLERLLTTDHCLPTTFPKTRVHALQWAFLESLGYFTFMGMLLVQTSSYRTGLAMCLITVISISLLCYLVADLDSPFYGFFRVPLVGFARLTERLETEYHRTAAEVMLEKSFVDL